MVCKPTNATAVQPSFGWQGWFVIADIIVLFVTLFNMWVPIDFAMVCAILVLMSSQILAVSDGVAGWANTTVLAIACLLAIADALAATGSIDYYVSKFIGRPKTLGGALVRMMVPGMFIAAWISSTAVVAIMLPIVARWARKIDQPLSKLLMPLCFAIHLGGTCTLIGTTTNLVIYAFATTYYCHTWSIFFVTSVGLPVAVCGMGILLLIGPPLLPSREEFAKRQRFGINYNQQDRTAKRAAWARSKWLRFLASVLRLPVATTTPSESVREIKGNDPVPTDVVSDNVVYALVPRDSPVVGQAVQDAGLRRLQDLFLVSVLRGDTRYTAVGGEFVLQAGDVLAFAGVVTDFVKFTASKGLKPVEIESGFDNATQSSITADPVSQHTIEAVVRSGSVLIGNTPKSVNFRSTYKAAIIGIYRAGERIGDKIGQITFKVGDVVVAVVGPDFDWDQTETRRDLKPRYVVERPRISGDGGSTTTLTVNGDLDSSLEQGNALSRNYLFSMRVASKAPLVGMASLVGKTVEQAALRHVPGVELVALERKGDAVVRAVPSDFVLAVGDILWFVGERDGLASLRIVAGLEDADNQQIKRLKIPTQHRRLLELVLSPLSEHIGKTVRETRFRTRYEAVIVAVQRAGTRLFTRIGDIVFDAGDVLIIDAGPTFVRRFGDDPNFLIVSEIVRSEPPRHDRFMFALLVCVAMVSLAAVYGGDYVPTNNPSIAASTTSTIDLVVFTAWALGLLLAFGVTTRSRVYRAIDWGIVITIAAGLALAIALTNTGVAAVIGNAITNGAIAAGWGQTGVLAIIMILTEILAALITAKAGASVMFPVAFFAAAKANINPDQMLIALMLGASDFTTPQGHQINMMIQSPGAYRFADYQIVGIPFEILINVLQVVFLVYSNYAYVNIPVSFVFLALCICIDHVVVEKKPLRSLTIFQPRAWPRLLADFLLLFYPFSDFPSVEGSKRALRYVFTLAWARDLGTWIRGLRRHAPVEEPPALSNPVFSGEAGWVGDVKTEA